MMDLLSRTQKEILPIKTKNNNKSSKIKEKDLLVLLKEIKKRITQI